MDRTGVTEVHARFERRVAPVERIAADADAVARACPAMAARFRDGGKLLVCTRDAAGPANVPKRGWINGIGVHVRPQHLPGEPGRGRLLREDGAGDQPRRVVVANTSGWEPAGGSRPAALRHSLVAAHTLAVTGGGRFVSLLDPPEWAAPGARECRNERTWPVLVGDPERAEGR